MVPSVSGSEAARVEGRAVTGEQRNYRVREDGLGLHVAAGGRLRMCMSTWLP